MRFSIRSATTADVAVLSALAAETFVATFGHLYPERDLSAFLRASYAPEVLTGQVSDPGQAWWIVEDETGAAVGYAQAGPCGLPHVEASRADGELKRLYLKASAQGAGLGKRLFETTLSWLEDRFDGRPLWIGVWSENARAQALYGAYGFRKVGEYLFMVGETADPEWILRRG